MKEEEEEEEEERKRKKKERKKERKSGNKRNVAVCGWTGETRGTLETEREGLG